MVLATTLSTEGFLIDKTRGMWTRIYKLCEQISCTACTLLWAKMLASSQLRKAGVHVM